MVRAALESACILGSLDGRTRTGSEANSPPFSERVSSPSSVVGAALSSGAPKSKFQSAEGSAFAGMVRRPSVWPGCDTSEAVDDVACMPIELDEPPRLLSVIDGAGEPLVPIPGKTESIKWPCCITTDLGIDGGVSWIAITPIPAETERIGSAARPASAEVTAALAWRVM